MTDHNIRFLTGVEDLSGQVLFARQIQPLLRAAEASIDDIKAPNFPDLGGKDGRYH